MAGDLSDRGRWFIDRYILHTTQKAETRARKGREAEAELAKVALILDEYEGTNSPTAPIVAKITDVRRLIGEIVWRTVGTRSTYSSFDARKENCGCDIKFLGMRV